MGGDIRPAVFQAGQAAAVDGGVAVQQQIPQFWHGGKGGEALHMKDNQGVIGQPLYDLCGQLRDLKFLFSVLGQDTVSLICCLRPF